MSPLERWAGWRAWPESVGRWLAAWVLLVGVLLGSGYAESYGRYLSNWSPEGWSRSALGVPSSRPRPGVERPEPQRWSSITSSRRSLPDPPPPR